MSPVRKSADGRSKNNVEKGDEKGVVGHTIWGASSPMLCRAAGSEAKAPLFATRPFADFFPPKSH